MKIKHTISGGVLNLDDDHARGFIAGGQYTAVEEETPKRQTTSRRKKTEPEDTPPDTE